MKKLSKNPIDQYFRENLGSPDLEYNNQDWKGLEKMLPTKPKKKSAIWWLPASIAAAVVLLFLSFLLFNKPVDNTEKMVKKVSEDDKISVDNNLAKPSKALSDNKTTASETSGYSIKGLQKSLALAAIPEANLSDPGEANIEDVSPEPAILKVPFTGVLNLHDKENLYAGSVPINDLSVQIPQQSDQNDKSKLPQINKKDPEEDSKSKFSLGLSLSPDINSISKFSESSFGKSAGLVISYQISPRLSVNTAVAYSKKVYSAEPHQYKAPWAYSSAGRNAKFIDADCRVLDIPLSLSYSIFKSNKRTIFASAGVSSYFMLKEKYTLITDSKPSGYPPYSNPSYAYSNENQHLLSVINLSAGISKPISKQTSLVVEPYMRLPVTGIGQGKVHLKSIGLNFQLKYNFKKSGLK